MRNIILILLLLMTSTGYGKPLPNPIGNFNSEAFWKTVKLEKSIPNRSITDKDTTIVVISNRKANFDSLRYMTEERDGTQLHYFFVYSGGGLWHVLPVATLEQAIALEPKKNDDWVVYTEGMGKLFTSDIARGIGMAGEYKVNVILLDYPSISTTKRSLGNYFFAMKNARTNYKDFSPAMEHIKKLRDEHKMGSGKISLFYHSMGNNLQRDMVLHHKLGTLNNEMWVDNLILNAPCVPRRGTGKWLNEIHYARHIYVHYNTHDYTLGGAYLVSKRLQLGQRPLRKTCKDVIYINFNMLCDRDHSNFLSIPGRAPAKVEAIRHYSTLLHGADVNLQDERLYRPTNYKHVGWDILPDIH
ncbi:MAG: alpha/beta hydrolase [Flavipsychrobacter sp.]